MEIDARLAQGWDHRLDGMRSPLSSMDVDYAETGYAVVHDLSNLQIPADSSLLAAYALEES